MKKIAAVFTAIIAVFMLSVNCFAATIVVDNVDKPIDEKTYSVKIYDQIDEDQDIIYVDNSSVKIYKLTGGNTTNLQTETLYITLTTNEQGEASTSLPAGSYVIKEENVTIGTDEYESQDIQITIDESTSALEVYLKHSPVEAPVIITEPATEEPTTADVPFTGSQAAVGAVAVVCIAAAVVAIIVVTKKKDKKTDENTEKTE